MNKFERIKQNLMSKDPAFAVEYAAASLLGELITQRVARGLTQADVAERSGLTQSAVARIEGLQSNVTLATLVKYASAVGSRLEAKSIAVARSSRYRQTVSQVSARTSRVAESRPLTR